MPAISKSPRVTETSSVFVSTSVNFKRSVLKEAKRQAKAEGYRSVSSFVNVKVAKALGIAA